MVATLFIRSLIPWLILVSLVNAAITLKLEKHHDDSHSPHKRSQSHRPRSNFVPPAPATEVNNDKRLDSHERLRSWPKRQDEAARWAALLAQLSPPAEPSSTTASGSGTSDGSATGPAPTYPSVTNVDPPQSEGFDTPYTPFTPPVDPLLYPTTTESTTTSSVFTDSHPSPTYSLGSSTASPLPSQSDNGAPFEDDDGANIPLYSPHDVTYTIKVVVAGQPLDVIIDTGSTVFWVATQNCTECVGNATTGAPPTNPRAVAPISIPAGCKEEPLYYGKGQVSGCMTHADLSFGDFQLPQHALLGVYWISDELDSTSKYMSGIIGVGMAHGNLIGGDPPLVTLFKQHMEQSPTVGFYIDRAWDQGNSEITLGDVTESRHVNVASALTLSRATIPPGKDDRGWYIVNIDKVMFGDLALPTDDPVLFTPGLALLDTGSTNLLMPGDQLNKIYQKMNSGKDNYNANAKLIEEGSRYIVRCEKPGDASEITITLGGRDWHIPYGDIIGSQEPNDTQFCRSRLSPLKIDQTTPYRYILGGVFLKNVYSSYNIMDGTVTLYDVVQ